MTQRPDLVVFSHLRWVFVWQRPQHLVARLARDRRVWFVEEPVAAPVDAPRLRSERAGDVERVWLEVPDEGRPPSEVLGDGGHIGYDDREAGAYAELPGLLPDDGRDRVAWLYTPLALPYAAPLEPTALVYDVMDDLAAFQNGTSAMRRLQGELLERADLVLTGGRSLFAGVADRAPGRAFLFPSGVEPEHYAAARRLRRPRPRPVAGYVGVIDERVDLGLVAGLAERLPDWDVELVGPFAKIKPASAPQAPNLRYPGMQPYERLPAVMAGFDVALMPFALGEATRAISPTKTLEYLAADLPVVSTRVPDVVADYTGVVAFADDAEGFATACRRVMDEGEGRAAALGPLLRRYHWDAIAARMARLLDQVLAGEPLADRLDEPTTPASASADAA
jgi:glycosyltransferase involved in cell wall biosynthesis